MIPVVKALQIVLSQTTSLPLESVSLTNASGRILAEDIIADSDLSPVFSISISQGRLQKIGLSG